MHPDSIVYFAGRTPTPRYPNEPLACQRRDTLLAIPLDYLLDMLAFEERARRAQRLD
jgi:hypothetical protein